jgi:hypothetical protein
MSYPYPYQSPGLDPTFKVSDPFVQPPSPLPYNGNSNSAYNVNPGGSPNLSPTGTRKPQQAIVSLWKEQLVAIIVGTVILTLGAMVLAAYFARGPLHILFIQEESFSGRVVNPSNTAALIAALATFVSFIGRFVAVGISRAWLRRLAVSGRGATIRQWSTISAGVSLRDVRRTPFITGGVLLLFTLAMAINSAALAGAGVPNIRYQIAIDTYGPVTPFRGNGGTGGLVDCMDIQETQHCASWQSLADVMTAFSAGYNPRGRSSYYPWASSQHITISGYLAAVDPPLNLETYDTITTESPVSMYNTTCFELNAGSDPVRQQYSWRSTCYEQDILFGNSSVQRADWIAGAFCGAADEHTSIIEIAFAGRSAGGAKAYQCEVNGYEAMGTASRNYDTTTTIRGPEDDSSYQILSPSDMTSTVTALLAAIKSEAGLEGKTGPMGSVMLLADTETGADHLLALANSVNNAIACAATYGYNGIAGSNVTTYTNTISSLNQVTAVRGYGWSDTPRALGWSIVCIVIGLAWYAAAVYMIRGGTRYDPTDWFQTMNTSAGSNLNQIQGTCTGAGLQGRKLKKTEMWYGELAPGHVGFAQQPTNVVNPAYKYGQVVSDPV